MLFSGNEAVTARAVLAEADGTGTVQLSEDGTMLHVACADDVSSSCRFFVSS